MKRVLSYLCFLVALVSMIGVVACGGTSTFELGGTVTGLNQSGLVLANGGSTVAIGNGASSYVFPNKIDYGTSYRVSVQTQPRHLACGVANASGTAGTNLTTAVNVICSPAPRTLSGRVSGLTAPDLALSITLKDEKGVAAGGTSISLAAGATSFSFPSVPDGFTYAVSVVETTGTGVSCSVVKGGGVMGEVDVTIKGDETDLVVTCIPGHFIGAAISGLSASGLELGLTTTTNGVAASVVDRKPAASSVLSVFKSVPVGSTYVLAVTQQPTGLTCSVPNPTGTMGTSRIEVAVVCVAS